MIRNLATMIPADTRYALLANGSAFSCHTLARLLEIELSPSLIVLPEYPPAIPPTHNAFGFQPDARGRKFIELASNTPLAFAPLAHLRPLLDAIDSYCINFILVVCWPYLIDQIVVERMSQGCLNLHPSLLPEFRGANPIAQQILTETNRYGVTLHLLSDHFDQGDIVAQAKLATMERIVDATVLERCCAALGAELFAQTIVKFGSVEWVPVGQSRLMRERPTDK